MGKERWILVSVISEFEDRLERAKLGQKTEKALEIWLAYRREGRKAFKNGYDAAASRFLREFVEDVEPKCGKADWNRAGQRVAHRLAELFMQSGRRPNIGA
jgi:hypothetical protein